MTNAIEVADLVKIYGPLRAVDGISFQVEPGQIFGMLGPNGAGKSTTVEIVEGLRTADSGEVRVLGTDVRRHPRQVKERIGVQLQSTAFYKQLSPRQLLRLFASFFSRSLPVADLIAMVNLEEKADAPSDSLSGGQRQRLAIAVALVNDPAIVFLDEPTTGLDPQARRSLWDVISRLRSEGKTVLLTTHYLEEAERLCDKLVVIDHGKVIAAGTPQGLINEHFERAAVEFVEDAALPLEMLERLPAVDKAEQRNGQSILFSTDSPRTAGALLETARQAGVELKGFSIRTATLEDVFLKLTGRRIRE
jgi:ABC-2 type transport system ATP-binding protein